MQRAKPTVFSECKEKFDWAWPKSLDPSCASMNSDVTFQPVAVERPDWVALPPFECCLPQAQVMAITTFQHHSDECQRPVWNSHPAIQRARYVRSIKAALASDRHSPDLRPRTKIPRLQPRSRTRFPSWAHTWRRWASSVRSSTRAKERCVSLARQRAGWVTTSASWHPRRDWGSNRIGAARMRL